MDERDYRAMNKELQEEPKQEALTYTEAAKKEERIIQFSIYPKSGHVDKLGRDNAREIAEKAILKAIEKIK